MTNPTGPCFGERHNKQMLLSRALRFKGSHSVVRLVRSRYGEHLAAGERLARSRFADR